MTHASPHGSANLRSPCHARDAISPVSDRSTRRTAYPRDRADAAEAAVRTFACLARVETRQFPRMRASCTFCGPIMHRGANRRSMRRRGGRSASLGPSHEHRPSDETRGRAVRARAGIHAPPNGGLARAYTKVRSSKLVAPLLHRVDAGLRSFSTKSRGLGVFSRASSSDPASKKWDWYVS